MKPLILLTFSILLLSSCTKYRYDVTYEKCNGQTGSLSYIGNNFFKPSINEGRYYSVPQLDYNEHSIRNVCEFSYTRNPIE